MNDIVAVAIAAFAGLAVGLVIGRVLSRRSIPTKRIRVGAYAIFGVVLTWITISSFAEVVSEETGSLIFMAMLGFGIGVLNAGVQPEVTTRSNE